jgi:preprotein translocase subunit SecF
VEAKVRFFKSTNINFIGHRHKFFAVSGFLLLITITGYIYVGGPNYGIDFAGGMLMQVSFQSSNVDLQDVRNAVEKSGINSFELQSSENLIMIRARKNLKSQEQFENSVKNSIHSKFPDNPVRIEKVEYVGPSVGEYLTKQAVRAFLFAFLGVIVYMTFRFKSSLWGIAAIIGIIHDVAISLGFVILMNKEIDITVIAALLTVVGYSINDTIVLFDRIKENLRLCIKEDFANVINKSINEVLVRTIVTSLTVFIVAGSLFFFGGETIHTFAYIMIIGTVLGVFSTIFICTPLVYEWEVRRNNRLKSVIKQKG